jgi:hypothetical protein
MARISGQKWVLKHCQPRACSLISGQGLLSCPVLQIMQEPYRDINVIEISTCGDIESSRQLIVQKKEIYQWTVQALTAQTVWHRS